MTAESRERFAAVVRQEPVDLALACLLVGVEVTPELDVAASLAELDALAARARPFVPAGADPGEVARGLQAALGGREGFSGAAEDYADVRSSLLHEVLRRRRGLPLLLSVVWVEVARRLGVPAEPVGLPGHVVVALGTHTDSPVLVDAYGGGQPLAGPDVQALVQGATGRPLRADDLEPTGPRDLLLRLLTNVRALAARSPAVLQTARTRLWAVELSLLLPRHPAALRRERGQLLVRLGDHLGGAAELASYADAVEAADPDEAAAARSEAAAARARLN